MYFLDSSSSRHIHQSFPLPAPEHSFFTCSRKRVASWKDATDFARACSAWALNFSEASRACSAASFAASASSRACSAAFLCCSAWRNALVATLRSSEACSLARTACSLLFSALERADCAASCAAAAVFVRRSCRRTHALWEMMARCSGRGSPARNCASSAFAAFRFTIPSDSLLPSASNLSQVALKVSCSRWTHARASSTCA
mmetsp:Transcript_19977/g.50536  ORF Transcript_19977/g.50536 Transcript_19977/m.50536 type:complete len:202 (+) Transcript_19977:204-809(+)